ncbi:MAG: RluA family pseudouridine synthase [bacterium]|nr:RluA family pseudouridine synthase [bacterium]
MAKFNSSDILKILRKFGVANEQNVPRHIEELKKDNPDEFSEIFSFKFQGDKFFVINDGIAEDDEFYILELLRRSYGEIEGRLLENPQDDFSSFALPFEGKDIYIFRNIPSKLRLDVVLAAKNPELSRSSIQKYIKQGYVKVNSKVVSKPRVLVGDFDKIELEIPEKTSQEQAFEIIFEDENVIVANKPRGILTHSKGVLNDEFTMADFFKAHGAKFASETNRCGIIHRLDRETSGVIIGAKNDQTAKKLQKQFSERTVKKTYFAIAKDEITPQKALIDLPIARNNSAPSTFVVNAKGKPAQTSYEVLRQSPHFSLVKLAPKTGRTHQLRVHLSYLGHPILGDRVYDKSISKKEIGERMFLHAAELEITIPPKAGEKDSQRMVFEAPIPPEFEQKMNEK